jgi:sodium/hydrogen antiporter
MKFVDRGSYVALYSALSLFTIGVTNTIGSDDLLAAFAAGEDVLTVSSTNTSTHVLLGCAMSWDGHFHEQTKGEVFSSVIVLVLNCGCFVYIGAWLPFETFDSPELGITVWRLVVLFLVILVLRRIPALLLLFPWVPEITSWREALFSGHFGE